MVATASDQIGRLVDNIVYFTQALRKAGVKTGTAQVETAIRAVEAAGFSHRVDFYHTLRATLITRADDLEVFHQVFSMFWRDPEFLDSLMQIMSPRLQDDRPPRPPAAARRRAEDAFKRNSPDRAPKSETEVTRHAVLTWSGNDVFKRMDFEQMSAAELAEAERAVLTLRLPVPPMQTRRSRPDPTGSRVDARATVRAACRRAGEIHKIERKAQRTRKPDLVAICDISGSMSVYSRMVLRFLHAITHAPKPSWNKVHAFTFGTSLTNVTRGIRLSDPDVALAAIGTGATDWEGGTKIGAALAQFNKAWSRRLLGSGGVVLLISDGLERGDMDQLNQEAARLARSARQFVWLNPLLRFDGFAPKASGINTLLRHVDSFHACHSLDSFQALSVALGQPDLRNIYLAESRASPQ